LPPAEVPQAAAIRASPARPAGANHRLRIADPYLLKNGCLSPARNLSPVRS
jgi:hypothetical protein